MLRQMINVGGGDLCAVRSCRAGDVGGVGGDEVLGQVVQDRGKTIVFVEARECPSSELSERRQRRIMSVGETCCLCLGIVLRRIS